MMGAVHNRFISPDECPLETQEQVDSFLAEFSTYGEYEHVDLHNHASSVLGMSKMLLRELTDAGEIQVRQIKIQRMERVVKLVRYSAELMGIDIDAKNQELRELFDDLNEKARQRRLEEMQARENVAPKNNDTENIKLTQRIGCFVKSIFQTREKE